MTVIHDPRITTQQGRFSDEQLYTLAEIEELAERYADTLETPDCSKLAVQVTLLKFVEWLQTQEKEASDGAT